ncbi:MAG: SusC/RagA family TonB-linked outer membrane protein [Flavobacteriaceae bacterium]|nr:MAG: SusC/RagA family TonB-linked outer membrane protein [Flavobacteriaceae bacterium]
MKTKFNGILTLLLALVVQFTFAQEKQISGTVSDETGPLPGVSVIIKGTNTGAETDFDGLYTITANVGDILTYNYVGMTSVTKKVGTSNTINVTLTGGNLLEEVVITSLGIKREKKALGYAVSTVKSALLEDKSETDVARILTGKVTGVDIIATGGMAGQSTNVIIRSKGSITGNNQPLYIVDGAPYDSARFNDLDPNNIKSLSVLKGLSASTLYGQEGKNGVILVATKTGSSSDAAKKFEVEISQTSYITQIANLPEFQNKYGQGADQEGQFGTMGSWGAAYTDLDFAPHPYATGDIAEYKVLFPELQGVMVPYKAVKNNVSDFFNTGVGSTTSAIITGRASEFTTYGVNFGLTTEDGYLKGNNYKRLNLGTGGQSKLTNNLTISTTFNFTQTTGNLPTQNIFDRLLYLPRNLDIHNIPYSNPVTGGSVFYRSDLENPLWQLENIHNKTAVNRFFTSSSLNYKFNDNFSFKYALGLDTYTKKSEGTKNSGGVYLKSRPQDHLGYIRTSYTTNTIWDHNFIFSGGNLELSEDLYLNALVGFNMRSTLYDYNSIKSTEQIVFGFFNHSNFRNHDRISDYNSKKNVLGLYSQLEFAYKNYLYFTMAGRNDWGSTLEKANQTLFYPSTSVSFIPTQAFGDLKGEVLNFLKLRAGYGTSAGFPEPYATRPNLEQNANAFVSPVTGNVIVTNGLSSFIPNYDLKPELVKELEVGIEGKMFDGKIDFDITAYHRISKDQILTANTPESTGYFTTQINAGRIDTKGLEAGITIKPFTGDLQWVMTNNFTAYETEVIDIPQAKIDIVGGINYAIEGYPLGVFLGTYSLRDDHGNLLINAANGKVLDSKELALPDKIIGDPNPDWKLSNINYLTYKGLTLSAQVDYTHGGDIFSYTSAALIRRGVTRDTEERDGTYVIPGVLATNDGELILDADGKTIPNTIQLGANDLYFTNLIDQEENIVYDGSTLRLRDVSISYKLDSKILKQTPFGRISLTLSGQNLWFKAFNLPEYINLDPETLGSGVGNGMGLDYQTAPSYKKIALTIKATF